MKEQTLDVTEEPELDEAEPVADIEVGGVPYKVHEVHGGGLSVPSWRYAMSIIARRALYVRKWS